jgi:hypothetical protein
LGNIGFIVFSVYTPKTWTLRVVISHQHISKLVSHICYFFFYGFLLDSLLLHHVLHFFNLPINVKFSLTINQPTHQHYCSISVHFSIEVWRLDLSLVCRSGFIEGVDRILKSLNLKVCISLVDMMKYVRWILVLVFIPEMHFEQDGHHWSCCSWVFFIFEL